MIKSEGLGTGGMMKRDWIRKSQSGVTVVFVHGVLSSGETCWRNANGSYWPSLLAAEESIKAVGIYVFTYRTNIFSGSYRLGDVVDALKEYMRLDGLFECHTLVFVAHSMGGLVVRKLIVERAIEFRDNDISVALFLVASPSLGSRYANLLEPMARWLGHSHADALRFSQDNHWLMDLDKEFTNLKEAKTVSIVGKELVEDVFIAFKGLIQTQVVEPFAGARYFGEPFKVPASDHFSIAKPESAKSIQHELLVEFIAKLPRPIEQELRARLEDRRAACAQAEVPFRTFHKLAALFAMQSRFTSTCFEAAGRGTAARIEAWLREAIQSQRDQERGQGLASDSIDSDDLTTKALQLARAEHAAEINERHYLLALLDGDTGTMREIRKYLRPDKMKRVRATAESDRPRKLVPGVSQLISIRKRE
jgi:hypothetical protein